MAQIMREASLDAFPHGHGLGLEMRDYPILVPDTGLRIRDNFVDLPADLTIEEGMVIDLEAPLFEPGIGSLHRERSFLVTAVGAEPLVHQDRSAPLTVG